MIRWLATLTFFVMMLFSVPAAAQVQDERFSETLHIGRGAVLDAQWHPSGNVILVDTVLGAWVYSDTMADVAQLPDIRLAKFSLDGTVVAGIDSANQLTLWAWDSQTFTQFAAYPSDMAYVTALEWSPDGEQIATLDRTGRILVWDVVSAKFQFEVRLNGATQIAWSKGGSYLAASNPQTQTFVIWNRAGDFIMNNTLGNNVSYGWDIEWQDDSHLQQRVYGFDEVSGILWDIPTKQIVGQQAGGTNLAYNPDGSKIALGFWGGATIADSSDRNNQIHLEGPRTGAIAWSPSGKRVAFGDWALDTLFGSAKLWVYDVESRVFIQQFSAAHRGGVRAIYWSPDEKTILTVDFASQLFIWPVVESDETIDPIRLSTAHTDIGATMAWSGDGSVLVTADTNSGSRAWDAHTGASLTEHMNIDYPATQIIWQPGGTLIATRSGTFFQSADANIYIWDMAAPTLEMRPLMVIPHTSHVADMAWSPDGKTLASAERGEYIRLWSPMKGNEIHAIDLCLGGTYCGKDLISIGWSTDSKVIDYAYDTGDYSGVQFIDPMTENRIGGWSPAYGTDRKWTAANQFVWVYWGGYHETGDRMSPLPPLTPKFDMDLSIGDYHGTDSTFEVSTGNWNGTLDSLSHPIRKAILSPHGSKVIGFDVANDAIIWDLEPQSLRVRLYGVKDAVWSPDEKMLVTYGVDGVLRVVDATTGDILHSFDDHYNVDYPRIGVFWSPDSQKIALLDRGALFIYEKSG